MKNLLSAVVAVLTFVSIQAHAIYNPSWERPIYTATMTPFKAQGALSNVNVAKVTLTKRDGAIDPTGITVQFNTGAPINFSIHTVQRYMEGAVYIATQIFPTGTVSEGGYSIQLTSNSQLPIAHNNGPVWSANVYETAFGASIGEVDLQGRPTGVITPQ